MNHVETGLNDEPDVKGPAFALLAKLAAQQPALVLSAAERIATALENTLTARLKSDAVKQARKQQARMLLRVHTLRYL